ncbi:Uncharacterized protein AB751O23_AG_00220 [Chlamydiales bacterium SCGC AB-751-O23]|jgi:carboxyl-terminal processing protease|nr:Uncharacterized protein AB751O23_AG_00220 [Chlamydiales bacterium SCGC AB-751-O23]
MLIRLFKLLIIISFTINSASLLANEERKLTFDDISPIMEQIFSYHVDQKDLSELTVKRALKIYIKQFDPAASYFLASETLPYVHPKAEMISTTLTDFQEDKFSVFEETNALIQTAIERNRRLRENLFNNYHQCFEDAKQIEALDKDIAYEDSFPRTEEELKERVYDQALRFFRAQSLKNKRELTSEEEEKVVKLYLRKLKNSEDMYTFTNFNKREHTHLSSLRILKSLAKSLDSHTAFFSSAEAYNMRINLEKGFQGIGVVLEETFDGVKINRIIKGGPADKSQSIKQGDYIVSVNGTDITTLPFYSILELIRGEKDTKITLGLKRIIANEEKAEESAEKFLSIILKRGKVTLDDQRVDISHESFGEGIIGKIVLHSFYEGEEGVSSESDLKKALEDLSEEGEIKGLILDLRDNSGGFLSQAVKVAGLFISNGVIVTSKYSNNDQRVFRDLDGKTFYDGPLVVLTSKASASAAEIVAQGLQDYGASVNVGETTTYGKGSIQHQTITNPDSTAHFKVTVGRYYTVSGKSTQINGVQADIIVPGKFSNEEVGERYLEHPLAYDSINSSFDDSLADLDTEAQKWFRKYYTPSLEKPDSTWKNMLPILRKNSSFRIQHSEDYQNLLTEVKKDINLFEKPESEKFQAAVIDLDDIQGKEAVNILKDMILMQNKTALHH